MPDKRNDDKYQSIIEQSKKHLKEKKETRVEEELVKVVIFSLKGVFYAFYGELVKGILPYTPVTFVPGCPDYILGIINVRGDIESVININHFIGSQSGPVGAKSRIVIAEAVDIRSGIVVDSVEDVVDVPVGSISPSISTIDQSVKEFVEGEFQYKSSLVTVFNLERIFSRIDTD